MTDRARKLLQDALALSDDERLALADHLRSTVAPEDIEWFDELVRPPRPSGSRTAWPAPGRRVRMPVG